MTITVNTEEKVLTLHDLITIKELMKFISTGGYEGYSLACVKPTLAESINIPQSLRSYTPQPPEPWYVTDNKAVYRDNTKTITNTDTTLHERFLAGVTVDDNV